MMEAKLAPPVPIDTIPAEIDTPPAVSAEQQPSPEVSTATCQRLGTAACLSCARVSDCMFATQLAARGEQNPARDREDPDNNAPRVGEGRDALFDEKIEIVVAPSRPSEGTTQRPKPEAPRTLDSNDEPKQKPMTTHATNPTESGGEPTMTAGAPLQNKQPATVNIAKLAEAKPRPTVEKHQQPQTVQETPEPRSIDAPKTPAQKDATPPVIANPTNTEASHSHAKEAPKHSEQTETTPTIKERSSTVRSSVTTDNNITNTTPHKNSGSDAESHPKPSVPSPEHAAVSSIPKQEQAAKAHTEATPTHNITTPVAAEKVDTASTTKREPDDDYSTAETTKPAFSLPEAAAESTDTINPDSPDTIDSNSTPEGTVDIPPAATKVDQETYVIPTTQDDTQTQPATSLAQAVEPEIEPIMQSLTAQHSDTVSEPLQEISQDQTAEENDIAAEEPELIPFEPVELPPPAHELPDNTAPTDRIETNILEESADSTAHDTEKSLEPKPLAAATEPIAVDEQAYELIVDEQLHTDEKSSSLVSDEIEPSCPYTFAEDEELEAGLEESASSLDALHGQFTKYLGLQSSDDIDEKAEEPKADVVQSFDYREDQPASNNGNTRKASELARQILGRNAFVLAA